MQRHDECLDDHVRQERHAAEQSQHLFHFVHLLSVKDFSVQNEERRVSQNRVEKHATSKSSTRSLPRRTDRRTLNWVAPWLSRQNKLAAPAPACHIDRKTWSRAATQHYSSHKRLATSSTLGCPLDASFLARPCTRACPRWREIQQALSQNSLIGGTRGAKGLQ